MDSWTLCVSLCILVARESSHIYHPHHEVTEMGQAVTLRCEPILGHNLLFWYRQTFVQGLELLSYFWSQSIIDDAGMPMDRFSAERPDGPFSTRKIQPTEQGDSAVCVCASRLAIALQNLPLPVQKFWCCLFSPQLPAILSSLSCVTPPTRIIKWVWSMAKTEDDTISTYKILCRR
uniref:Immunoglobulin V-set domain-containing protein n=1 Tax=Theropithecus gelada TaxID=9565 RepID=A0A8D2GGD6_THEGE